MPLLHQLLRGFECNVVENAVQKLVDRAYMDPLLRSSLGLQGTVTFESHTNLGTTNDDPISEPMGPMSLGEREAGAAVSTSASGPKPPAAPKARRRARGKGNRADQFCIYRTSDGQNVPALAIEYKAPHKLSVDEVATGLESEIWPERDVINKDGQGFTFTARALAAAVVTQLFSYMIGKGIQYGYVCTGQAFVFLHIPDDPSTVYFSVCVPNLDVIDDDETRLHRTAVAQVFAFILQALRTRPPPESWHDEAERLDTWAVEYDDILRNIPATERKPKEPHDSPYKPRRWKGFKRSPIRTRSRCQQPDASVRRPEDEDEEPPSPTPKRSRASGSVVQSTGRGGGKRGHGGGEKREQGQRRSRVYKAAHSAPNDASWDWHMVGPRTRTALTRPITGRGTSAGSSSSASSAPSLPPTVAATPIVLRSIGPGGADRSSRCGSRPTAIRLLPREWRVSIVPDYSTRTRYTTDSKPSRGSTSPYVSAV